MTDWHHPEEWPSRSHEAVLGRAEASNTAVNRRVEESDRAVCRRAAEAAERLYSPEKPPSDEKEGKANER